MKPAALVHPRFAPRHSLARRLAAALAGRIRYGELTLTLPDGSALMAAGDPAPGIAAHWQLAHYRALWRILTRGAIGLGEAYMAGEWDSPALGDLLLLAAVNEAHLGCAGNGLLPTRLVERLRHRLRRNSRRQARRNIASHYDLGNDFYAQWLDPGMTYSAALFAPDDDDLERAQARKYQRLVDVLGIRAEHRALEIGCGWGGFLEHAAQVSGARLHGISISREQCTYAHARLAAAGLSGRATVEFSDYRDVRGSFDRIVSIEMFEAVGEEYWGTYAAVLRRLLAPGGSAALQLITIEEARFAAYRRRADFIQHYIFPGGMLPSRRALARVLAQTGLRITDEFVFGRDYARTLVAWRARFDAAWPRLAALGFDERFKRMWQFYLAYCEAGFEHGAVDVVQLRVEHAG
jgi:cyclopropane-fatty-acyl-phospholipid synthase